MLYSLESSFRALVSRVGELSLFPHDQLLGQLLSVVNFVSQLPFFPPFQPYISSTPCCHGGMPSSAILPTGPLMRSALSAVQSQAL